MPVQTPCLGCGRLIPAGQSRCPDCATAYQRRRDALRGTAAERGYDAAWRRVRELVLDRDGYVCQLCGRLGANSVDHITPLARGGARLDPANLRAAHTTCNSALGGATRRP